MEKMIQSEILRFDKSSKNTSSLQNSKSKKHDKKSNKINISDRKQFSRNFERPQAKSLG